MWKSRASRGHSFTSVCESQICFVPQLTTATCGTGAEIKLLQNFSGYACNHGSPRGNETGPPLGDTLGNAASMTGVGSTCKTTPILLVHVACDVIGENPKV